MKERVIRLCAQGVIAINVRGTEYLQIAAAESEETAWKRMRGKLGTGKHLAETNLLRPQAVPHTEGPSGAQPVPDAEGPGDSTTKYGTPRTQKDERSDGGVSEPFEGKRRIFGEGTELEQHASGATSALNLLGKVESWGIATGTQIQDMALSASSLTGAQLERLLRALPDGITYQLNLKKEKR